jgi:hypothetical protein
MVDPDARMIAVYNGFPGGTWNTTEYARCAGLRLYASEERPISFEFSSQKWHYRVTAYVVEIF